MVCVATEGPEDRATDVKDVLVVVTVALLLMVNACCCIGRDTVVASEGGTVVPTM